jgi:hypothetical protein
MPALLSSSPGSRPDADLIVEHDIELETASQRARDHANGYRRWLGTLTATFVRERERRGPVDADIVLVFKPADELIIRRAGITTPVRLIEPWLDEPTDVKRT